MQLEQMSDFFTARVIGYDEHMLKDVEGCRDGYIKLAEQLPSKTETLLDLGCGTGLELDEIFKILPDVKVTGVDMTQAMLDQLVKKHPDKNLTLINASYFECDFGVDVFDTAVSFQTMHHFSHEDKIGLYKKIFRSLKKGGVYIEGDYMVLKQEDEDHYYRENERLRKEQNIPDGAFFHYDTPCTVENQIAMLKAAGFVSAEKVWRVENTTIVVAKK